MVQLQPRTTIHGRHRITSTRRSPSIHRYRHQTRSTTPYHRRNIRTRSCISYITSRLLQILRRKTHLQMRTNTPPLPPKRMDRTTNRSSLLANNRSPSSNRARHHKTKIKTTSGKIQNVDQFFKTKIIHRKTTHHHYSPHFLRTRLPRSPQNHQRFPRLRKTLIRI